MVLHSLFILFLPLKICVTDYFNIDDKQKKRGKLVEPNAVFPQHFWNSLSIPY